MVLTDKVLEKAREKAKESGHGSVEIIFDETKPFMDVVLHDRERVDIPMPSKGKIGGLGGKVY
jgi:hypothetical protein